jgi:hypothetical protein
VPLATIPAGNFTKTYFSWWVYLSVGWAFVATVVIIALPLWESWNDIKIVLKGILTCENAGPEESAEEYSEVQGGEIYGVELNLWSRAYQVYYHTIIVLILLNAVI